MRGSAGASVSWALQTGTRPIVRSIADTLRRDFLVDAEVLRRVWDSSRRSKLAQSSRAAWGTGASHGRFTTRGACTPGGNS
jgi:hypothetical protein